MDIILSVFLPLSLAFIMLSLGLGLTASDFLRVVQRPASFAVGAIAQVLLLPLVAYVIARTFALPPDLAVGLMILSFCPGGVTSNMLTRLALGDVALSVTLTGVISLLSILTVPFLVAWSVVHFMGEAAPPVDVTKLAIAVFLITTVPVLIGVLVRHFASALALRLEPLFNKIATVLFVIIVIGALASNWSVFIENLPKLGPALVVLNLVLLGIGYLAGTAFKRNHTETTSIAIETGIQNASLGITVGSLLLETANGLPPFSLPAGVYGITMYFVTLPFILWRRKGSAAG